MTDLSKFAAQETAVIELVDAADVPMLDDDGTPLTITVYSPGTKPYLKAQAVQSNRMMDRLKRKGKSDQTPEEKEREGVEFLVACTHAFSANIEHQGLKDEALFRAVYGDKKNFGFIADQVAKVLGDWSGFKKPSTES